MTTSCVIQLTKYQIFSELIFFNQSLHMTQAYLLPCSLFNGQIVGEIRGHGHGLKILPSMGLPSIIDLFISGWLAAR